ncbi:adenylosuccinate lyase [Weissella koreensis]|uniref:Adenylosuccinate lyase n=1 Tax=Weissella koreensis TaxID=165096 RepID=A0A7H1MN48_9LACO|nr:adenylosuccinate lyase [Weissella koreensis]AVH75680.1 adenylosuccinate lyase [Weissella koreensis]EJF34667.1 adenylosuccinate lyase [Weissella koreensis KCTC 3621]QGN20903.1 adenylosuccinate lyase [Weissella koreensis]QNT64884.1 adenylosuccinate lyase [Weissella koreensis]
MIERYTRAAMQKVWSLEQQYQSWLEVEIAVMDGLVQEGGRVSELRSIRPTVTELALVEQNAKFNVEEIADLEKVTKHDMVAFTRNISASLGPEKKWIHYGLTSTDVVDTAQALRLRDANKIIRKELIAYSDVLRRLTLKYKTTVMMGRTHGVHAEPTTFGLVLARYYQASLRNLERFDRVASEMETGKLSGSVGTFANISPEVEMAAMKRLKLQPQPVGSQVLPRDLHADYISTLALIGTSLEEVAVEIRGLQRSEIHEVEEGFAGGQKGSSSMPHKRNPIGSENIVGLSRVLRGMTIPAYENVPLWHERDISHSSAERVILPEATSTLDYMLHRMTNILDNLQVFPEQMKKNMNRTYGLIYSQRLMYALMDDADFSREQAYDVVQPLTARAWDEQIQFRSLVDADPVIQEKLSKKQVDDAFDYHWHLRHVDDVFARLNLNDGE